MGEMTMRTFAVEEIELEDLNALDLVEETQFLPVCVSSTASWFLPTQEAKAYRIAIYDAVGSYPEAESAQALYCPTMGRLGIAWGADATWADVESLEAGIEAWLNDPEAWEARR
tara:strand:+ start:89 stop:430 length:342 start_codon:yes stop_codon:yes gene_type:complete